MFRPVSSREKEGKRVAASKSHTIENHSGAPWGAATCYKDELIGGRGRSSPSGGRPGTFCRTEVGDAARERLMSQASAPKGGRDIVAYFAGHLANLVNGNDTLGDSEETVGDQAFFVVRARSSQLNHQSQIFRGAGRGVGLSAAQQCRRRRRFLFRQRSRPADRGARRRTVLGRQPRRARRLARNRSAPGSPSGLAFDLEGSDRRGDRACVDSMTSATCSNCRTAS